ncbi:MAG: molybdenum ABC transporter ATP-binding protein [Candidatus Firestonebacteria bacterium]|nr:molybdenum ABC transporter ATP-binding protein [Candidatus Firestonebacteria bacterium]
MELMMAFEKKQGAFVLQAEMLYSGRRLGVFGPSGCGKSTLAHVLAGLQPLDRGHLEFNGRVLEDVDRGLRVPSEQRRIGLVFQQPQLFPHLSVQENLLYGYARVPEGVSRLDPEQVIRCLALESLLTRSVDNLSGGEQQRVAVGRAVLASPQLMIFDEPVSALDEDGRYRLLGCMRELCDAWEIPYVYISHSVLEMRLMTDDVMLMQAGCIQERLSPEELARQQAGASPAGYSNVLPLRSGTFEQGLWRYGWGRQVLWLTQAPQGEAQVGVVSAKDVMLFKQHPQAVSARNLLPGTVREMILRSATCGVVLDCGGQTLTAEVVHAAVAELALEKGAPVFAAIKASAFRLLPAGG